MTLRDIKIVEKSALVQQGDLNLPALDEEKYVYTILSFLAVTAMLQSWAMTVTVRHYSENTLKAASAQVSISLQSPHSEDLLICIQSHCSFTFDN